jgi:hypothetical protein
VPTTATRRYEIGPYGRLQLKVNAGLLSKTDYWTR